MGSNLHSAPPPAISMYSLMVASIGLGTVSLGNVGGANLRFWNIFLIAILLAGFIGLLLKLRIRLPSPVSFLLCALLLFCVLISGVNATDMFLYIKQTTLLSAMLILFLIVAQRTSTGQLIQNLRWVAYPGVLIAGWGIVELVVFPENLQEYSSGLGLWPRARSFFSEANEFSQYLSLPFGFLLAMLSYYKPLGKPETWLLRFGLFIIVIAQALTFSRGGILAFVAELGAWGLLSLTLDGKIVRRLGQVVGGLLVVALAVAVLGPFQPLLIDVLLVLFERVLNLFTSGDQTTLARLDTISTAVMATANSEPTLIVGIGFGNLPVILGEGVANSGNFLIDIFSELGLLGLAIIFAIVGTCLVLPLRARRMFRKAGEHKMLAVFYGAYLSFVGLTIGGMTSPTHMLNVFWYSAGLLMALHLHHKVRQNALLENLRR